MTKKPTWWRENEEIKQSLDLPDYEPPRFSDGTYTHQVIPPLEEQYDCAIRILGINPRYPDKWQVRINGEQVAMIGRHRDNNGNTVYELTVDQFQEIIRKGVRHIKCEC